MEYNKQSSVHSDIHGELFPPLGSRGPKASKAWSYGGLRKDLAGNLIQDKMYCALCPKTFRYASSPGALQDHLNNRHMEEIYKKQSAYNSMLMEEKEEPFDYETSETRLSPKEVTNDTLQAPTKPRKMIFKLTETSPVQSKFHGDLFPPPGSKGPRASMCWTFGGMKKDSDGNLLKDKLYCALCPQTLGPYVSSPSNLRNHITNKHKEEILKEQKDYDLMLNEEKGEPETELSDILYDTFATQWCQK